VTLSLSCVSCRSLFGAQGVAVASEGFLGIVAFLRRLGDDRWCRIACSKTVAWMKMDDCFWEISSDKQIFDILHRGSINGGKTRGIRSESSVFLFKKCKHRSVMELCVTLVRCNQVSV